MGWSQLRFLRGVIDGGLLSDIHLDAHTTINFHGATFVGGRLQLQRIVLDGGDISFWDAEFKGGTVELYAGDLRSGTIVFINAVFSGGTVSLGGVGFSRTDEDEMRMHRTKIGKAHVVFDNCKVSAGELVLSEMDVEAGARVRFDRARIEGGRLVFDSSRFEEGSLVRFADTEITGGKLTFEKASIAPQAVDFRNTVVGPDAEVRVFNNPWDAETAAELFNSGTATN